MSAADKSERPTFQSDTRESEFESAPVSRMAVAALVLGVFSLLAPLTLALLPVCFVAAVLGAVALFRTNRDSAIAGALLAQIGLGLAIVSGVWAITATNGTKDFLNSSAGQYAEKFLAVLASGKQYNAMELTRIEPERQTTGTDLEDYYENGSAENQEDLDNFLAMDATKAVLDSNSIQWEYVREVYTHRTGEIANITVEMQNKASSDNVQTVYVTLERNAGFVNSDGAKSTALWYVLNLTLPE